jgi:lipopolysaccharide/colanic/teichoic acid biosynthesis glycosyltransferase
MSMLRMRVPASRASFKARVSVSDTIWAFVAPLLALSLRDAYILNYAYILRYDGLTLTALYCLISGGFSLLAFLAFRLHDGMPRYFSGHDALDVVKAVVCSLLMTYLVLFTVTRLQGIPRATPVIHAFILAGGLIVARVIARAYDSGATVSTARSSVARENIIMIGANHLSSLYIKLLNAAWPHRYSIVAVLDDRAQSTGRTMAGINILAGTNNLECIIDEFVVHGIETSRVIVGGDETALAEDSLKDIRRVCARKKIKLDFVPQLIGLSEVQRAATEPVYQPTAAPSFALPRYFEVKPLIDFVAALAMILFFPLLILAGFLVLLDVGMPLLFWQQRIGQGGRRFLLYKFRTLRAPFDAEGRPIPERQRLSRIGRLMRQSRLDELPQVLNILVGDMSLIGPRPLLPIDQPTNPTIRLMARPGITGWAQVNGGKFLTPAEKDQYDEYYVRNASPWFDLYIVWLTFKVIFQIGRHSDHAVSAASTVGFGKADDTVALATLKITDAPSHDLSGDRAIVPVAQRGRSNG